MQIQMEIFRRLREIEMAMSQLAEDTRLLADSESQYHLAIAQSALNCICRVQKSLVEVREILCKPAVATIDGKDPDDWLDKRLLSLMESLERSKEEVQSLGVSTLLAIDKTVCEILNQTIQSDS
jgi:hypothetical protein